MSKAKFNFIDALIILVILAAVAAGIFLAASGRLSAAKSGDAVKVRYQVEIKEKTMEYSEKIKAGDTVAVGDKEKAMAVVDSAEAVPFKRFSEDKSRGIVTVTEIPNVYDVILTLSSDGSQTDTAVYADGVQLRVGERITVRGSGYSGNGYIIGLEAEGQEESN